MNVVRDVDKNTQRKHIYIHISLTDAVNGSHPIVRMTAPKPIAAECKEIESGHLISFSH